MEAVQISENKTISILLIAASIVLMVNGVFSVEQFSVQYGVGAGALLQSQAYNVTVAPLLQTSASQLQAVYQSILESFLLAGIGFIMFAMAFVLLSHGPNRYEGYMRRYVPVHIMLAIVYSVLLLILHATFTFSLSSLNLYITAISICICVFFDLYLEYDARRYAATRRVGRDIRITPSTPFANMENLREQLFNRLAGDVSIVDKHFNSTAMSNLYRLIPGDRTKIKTLKILTSAEMLDSKFGSNYFDLKEELKNSNVEVELKIMKEEDATAQHERFIIDDGGAYKIPPLNIINRKSEHITRVNAHDARRRFDYLYKNSIKFENYLEKQGRADSAPQ